MRLYPIDDPDRLADAIDSLLADENSLASARAKAWWLGAERFNWEAERESLLNCVTTACRRRPGAANALPTAIEMAVR
jgi:hypothetical protein